jgi:hypothetical protein
MGCNCKKKPRQEPQVITSTPEPIPTPKEIEEDKQEN